MMKKRGRIGSALFMALVLAASIVTVPKVQAANAVDVDRTDCSVEFAISSTDPTAGGFEELFDGSVSVPVKLYKVASIDASGNYTAESAFTTVDVTNISSTTTAQEWEDKAKDAQDIVDAAGSIAVAGSTTLENGHGSITGLGTGLYLVSADESMSNYNIYTFKPYMVSLPNNYYDSTVSGSSDDWVYQLTGSNALSLKPEQTPRMGSLMITKQLENQNITMGDSATFVFEATITPISGDSYKEQAMITMNSVGDESVTIDDIPAGATVVVEEIYMGASYELVGTVPADGTVTIAADNSVGVTFTNTHNGKPGGGSGIDNYYSPDGDGIYPNEPDQRTDSRNDAL